MNQNLIDYIKKSKEQGVSDEEIKKSLLDTGWKEEDVNEGFKNISVLPVSIPTHLTPPELPDTGQKQKKVNVGRIIKWGFWGFLIGVVVGIVPLSIFHSFLLYWGIVIVLTVLLALYGARFRDEKLGTVSDEGLILGEKITAVILCIINPVIIGAIMYFMWRKRYPRKARQANHISLIVFLIEVVGYGVIKYVIK